MNNSKRMNVLVKEHRKLDDLIDTMCESSFISRVEYENLKVLKVRRLRC